MVELKADATYAIIGGMGGLGRAMIKWLADRGAKHIVSLSRSGAAAGDQGFIREIESMGVRMHITKCDVTSETRVASIARQFQEEPGLYPIRGVIQSSAVFEVRLHCILVLRMATTYIFKTNDSPRMFY